MRAAGPCLFVAHAHDTFLAPLCLVRETDKASAHTFLRLLPPATPLLMYREASERVD